MCDGSYCLNTGGAFESWYKRRWSVSGGWHIREGEVSGHYDLKVAVGKRYPGSQPSPLIDCLKPTLLFHNISQQNFLKVVSKLIDCLKPTQLFHNTSQQHVPKLSSSCLKVDILPQTHTTNQQHNIASHHDPKVVFKLSQS